MSEPSNRPGYTGVENLEVMVEACNYNTWLVGQIVRHLSPGAEVLDFGAGSGTFADMVRSKGFAVTCVEPDPLLRRMLWQQGLEAVECVSDLPSNRRFDLIYSLNVLEHIQDDHAAIHALAGLVSPGGAVLVYVPAFPILFTSMDRRVGHLRRYRLCDLRRRFEDAELQILECRYADCLGFAATLAYRAFGDRAGRINPRALKAYDRIVFPISRRLDLVFGRLFGKNALIVACRST